MPKDDISPYIVLLCRIQLLLSGDIDIGVVGDDPDLVGDNLAVVRDTGDANDDDVGGHYGPFLTSSRRLPPTLRLEGKLRMISLTSHETRSQPPKKYKTISTISLTTSPTKISSRAYICLSMIHFRTRSFSLNSSTKADIYINTRIKCQELC